MAIVLVFAFHLPFGYGSLDTAWVKGGFIGVDVFFVLSGFLITGVLAGRKTSAPPDLRRFLSRRVKRLLPAFGGLLAASLLGAALGLAAAGPDAVRQVALSATQSINWVFALGSPAPATFVSHTWSLALEWQWYIGWSAIVWVVLRMGGSKFHLMYGALIGAAVVAAWRSAFYATGVAEERLYYGFDTRGLDAFLIGAVIALALQAYGPPTSQWGRRIASGAAIAGLAALITLAWAKPTRDPFWYRDGGLTLAAIAAGALIYRARTAISGPLLRGLSWQPIAALGLISYSVYLWHWPVIVLTTSELTGWSFRTAVAVRIAATLAVSVASYLLLEKPFLRRASSRKLSPSGTSEPPQPAIPRPTG